MIRTLSIGFGDRVRSQANIPAELGVRFKVEEISEEDQNVSSSKFASVPVGGRVGVVRLSSGYDSSNSLMVRPVSSNIKFLPLGRE